MKPLILCLLAGALPAADPHAKPLQSFGGYNRERVLEALLRLGPREMNCRPAPELRSFRERFSHIADTQVQACSEDSGRPNPHPSPVEHEGLSKDEMAALRSAFAFCEGVCAGAEKKARARVVNVCHKGRHDGDIVTDLRLKGIRPPGAEVAARPQAAPPGPGRMETYYMGFLIKGPNWTASPQPGGEKLQEAHLAHLRKMAERGKLLVAGPFLDNTRIRGILVFKAASAEEARVLAGEDPAVRAGRLAVEVHPWMVRKGVLPE
jgi:uncharacterized protein YciI